MPGRGGQLTALRAGRCLADEGLQACRIAEAASLEWLALADGCIHRYHEERLPGVRHTAAGLAAGSPAGLEARSPAGLEVVRHILAAVREEVRPMESFVSICSR